MNRKYHRLLFVVIALSFLFAAGLPATEDKAGKSEKKAEQQKDNAETDPDNGEQQKKKEEEKQKQEKEEIAETEHTVMIGDVEIAYSAKAGTMLLKEEQGKPRASMFYVAYTRKPEADVSVEPAQRPVTFSFNGGPGSSAVWMHIGLLGPRRVALPDEPVAPKPPYKLLPNAHALLDVTDLVFIDPVSTGYSRAAKGQDPKAFHGVREDIEAMAEFIRLYLTREQRWASPKFLIGESYGATRAAGLAGHLQEADGIYLNGVMLISSVLDFQTISFDEGNDLPYVLTLPSYAAAAHFHGKALSDLTLDQVIQHANAFARGDYAVALMAGSALPAEQRATVVSETARLTGLAPAYIEQANLRVTPWRFFKELLRDERRTLGRFDARYKGIDRDAVGEAFQYDPSYTALQGVYTATINDYIRGELGYKSDLPYEILTSRVRPWNFNPYKNRYLDFSETLRKAMTINPHLRVFVGSGYYDMATPFAATEYTFQRLQLDESLRDHVVMAWYEAGHMMYAHLPSLVKMKKDLAAFIEAAK